MGGNGIYLPSVVRPYQSSIKSKKDSFPYGCVFFPTLFLLFISGFETFYNLNHLGMDWRSPPSEILYTVVPTLHSPLPAVTADTLPLTKSGHVRRTLYPVFHKKLLQSLTSDPVPEPHLPPQGLLPVQMLRMSY